MGGRWTLAGGRTACIGAHWGRQILWLATLQLLQFLFAKERPVLIDIVPHLSPQVVGIVRHGAYIREYIAN